METIKAIWTVLTTPRGKKRLEMPPVVVKDAPKINPVKAIEVFDVEDLKNQLEVLSQLTGEKITRLNQFNGKIAACDAALRRPASLRTELAEAERLALEAAEKKKRLIEYEQVFKRYLATVQKINVYNEGPVAVAGE